MKDTRGFVMQCGAVGTVNDDLVEEANERLRENRRFTTNTLVTHTLKVSKSLLFEIILK